MSVLSYIFYSVLKIADNSIKLRALEPLTALATIHNCFMNNICIEYGQERIKELTICFLRADIII